MKPDDLPALLGGPPARSLPPPVWPFSDDDVLSALQSCYDTGSWGRYSGGLVESLEADIALRFHVDHALTCASGTFAVELALRAVGVNPGDEVALSAYDFPGNFLNVHAIGALPVLVDVDARSWNLDPAQLEASLSPNTKAILVSHLHGGVVPMNDVVQIARKHGIPIVEDVAQMPGATLDGRTLGTFGDVGIISFGGSKLLSAGRGGAIVANNRAIFQKARTLQFRGNIVSPLSELQAAVLAPQLAKLSERNEKRRRSVDRLTSALDKLPGFRPFANDLPTARPGYYKVGFQFDAEAFGLSRDRFVSAAQAENLPFDKGFAGLHVGRSPSRFRKVGELAEATRAHHGALVLHHPLLLGEDREIDEIASGLWKIFQRREQLAASRRETASEH